MNRNTISRNHVSALLLAVALASAVPALATAQVNPQSQGMPYQRLAIPGEATVRVMVVGGVGGASGVYEIGESVDLDELLVLTGGAVFDPKNYRTSVIVYRPTSEDERTVIYDRPIERMLVDYSAYPKLQNGDIVLVQSVQRRQMSYYEVIRTISSAASLVLLAIRFSEMF